MQDRDENNNVDKAASGASFDAVTLSSNGEAERRLHLRAYKFWYNLLRGRLFPAISDMGPKGVDQFRENAILLDFPTDIDEPVLRFIGKDIAADLEDVDDLTGKPASNLPTGTIINRLVPHYLEVIAHRAPVGFEAEYDNPRGLVTMYRGILLPFSDNNKDVHFILGVIGWREVEQREAPRALAQGSSGSEVADRLAAVIEAGRAAAGAVHHVDSRSRESLYEALAHALGIYEESLLDRVSYERLLAGANLREQARAPFTPVVKLVFGAGYDKTRITEYSTALSYAHRLGVSSTELKEFLLFHEGGIKGCVLQERRSRRAARGGAPDGSADAPDAALATAPALAQVELSGLAAGDEGIGAPGDGDYVLLLGRRRVNEGDETMVDIIARIDERPAQMDATLRRAVVALKVDGED